MDGLNAGGAFQAPHNAGQSLLSPVVMYVGLSSVCSVVAGVSVCVFMYTCIYI